MAVFLFTRDDAWLKVVSHSYLGHVVRKDYMKLRRYAIKDISKIGEEPRKVINTYRGLFEILDEDGNCYLVKQIVAAP